MRVHSDCNYFVDSFTEIANTFDTGVGIEMERHTDNYITSLPY